MFAGSHPINLKMMKLLTVQLSADIQKGDTAAHKKGL